MTQIIIHNAETEETIIREMTEEELNPASIWSDEEKEKYNQAQINRLQAAAAKAALLEKLNITEEEAKLLLS